MSKPMEVTVPLVVKVNREGTIVGWSIEGGFPGFFSAAEGAVGVWDPNADQWGSDNDAAFANAAWTFVKKSLPKVDSPS